MADKRVEYTIGVKNEGLENLTRIIDELDKAGVETTEFKRQAELLRQQLADMARQQSLIDSFVKIKQETVSAGAAFEAAQAKAQQLGRELAATDAPTKKQTAEFGRARDAVNSTKDAYQATQLRLQAMRGTLTENNIETTGLAQKQALLRNGMREVEAQVAGATTRLKEMGGVGPKAVNDTAAATDRAASSAKGYQGALTQVASAIAGAFTFKELVNAAAQMESMREGLRAVSGSAEAAGRDMEFVRSVANRVGADVVQVGQAFLGLSAATKGTAVEGEPTRQVFEAVAMAMGKAGKSAAETQNALTALAQMASKGTVSMEELRGQLGEALPGALQAAANGLGITTQDLIKLVENGEIAASDLFPALSKGLKDLYGGAPAAQTLSQEITNIKNAFVEMAANLGEAGGLDALKKGAEVAQAAIVYLDDTLVTTGKTIGVVMAAIATLDFSGLKQSFTDIEAESRDKLLKAAQHNDVLRASIETGGTEAMKAALAQQQLGSATQQAGEAAAVTSPTWVKLASDYGKVLEVVREQIAAQEKSVIARDAEGKAAMAMAAAFGTETEQRQAQAKAAADNAAELEKLAQLKATELAVMNAELQALQALAKEQGKLDEQKQKQLQELEKLIALRQQDTDKAVAQAQASRMAATLAAAEAEALRDNSGRVKELRDAWEIARLTLEALNTEKRKGKATSEQVAEAEQAAGRAALLYRDALSDQVKAIQAKANAQQASISLEQAGVRLAIEQQRAIFEVARARGDESGAMRAQNEIRKLEIELLGLVAQAKRAEAQAALASIAAKREELQAAGLLTDTKRLELDAAEKSAQVKIKEAEIAETTAKKVRDLANAHRDLGAAAGSSVGGMNAATAAMGLQAEQLGKLQKLYDKHRLDKDKDPDRIGKSGDLREAAVMETDVNQEIARRYGEEFIDNDLAKKAFNLRLQLENYQKSYGNVTRSQESLNQQRNIGAELERIEREIEKERQGKKAGGTATPERPQAVQPSDKPSSSSSGGVSHVSNITIPGISARTQIRYADAQSQRNGEDLLRKLAQAKSSAIR
jgi:tape measure domain-containing protein